MKTPRRSAVNIYPKAGDKIVYQEREREDWKSLEITGRGGKSTSKLHKDYFNARTSDGSNLEIYLDKQIWRFDNTAKNVEEEENIVDLEE